MTTEKITKFHFFDHQDLSPPRSPTGVRRPVLAQNAKSTLRCLQNALLYTFLVISHHLVTFCDDHKILKILTFLHILTKDLRPGGDQTFFSDPFFTFWNHFFDQSVAFWGVLKFFLRGARGVLGQKTVLNPSRIVSRVHNFGPNSDFFFLKSVE